MAPRPNDGACFKCGQPGHYAKLPESESECTSFQSECTNSQPRNFNARPPAIGRGHVNHVKIEEAQEDTNIVMGTLPVNSVAASVLFDSGASHSFVSQHLHSCMSYLEYLHPP